ncbi:MAG: DEAD/DEAH box helicase [Pseudomonadota bacterium]
MSNFEQFDLMPKLIQAIKELGFVAPTPVQRKVLPLLLDKGLQDLVVLAQTGTGKTASYGLPLIQQTDIKSQSTQTLVLCPTRELCIQITKDLMNFGKYTPEVRVVAVYGGSSMETQIRALKRGAHVIVATPGRMNDLLRRKIAKIGSVKQLVLDEADEMLNMGFQEDLETILKEMPKNVRKLLFSATMSNQVASIAGRYMNNPEEIIVGQKNAGADNVIHECYTVQTRDRYEVLKRILDFHRNIYGIVFCRTRMETQDVASSLIADGYCAEALHGDIAQEGRERVMKKFRSKDIQILVATDVAARGLDVNDLTHVINYNLPDEAEAYTHRSGRTGRAGKEGVSIIICNPREEQRIRHIERIVKKKFTHRVPPTGQAVCESQLMGLLERLKQININNKQMEKFMPAIKVALEGMDPEEVIKRFLLLEFNRFLDYYKNAPDLGRQSGRERAPERVKFKDTLDSDMVALSINFGFGSQFAPKDMISLINHATHGPKIPIGKIRTMEKNTSFEIPKENVTALITNLNKLNFKNQAISVGLFDGGRS